MSDVVACRPKGPTRLQHYTSPRVGKDESDICLFFSQHERCCDRLPASAWRPLVRGNCAFSSQSLFVSNFWGAVHFGLPVPAEWGSPARTTVSATSVPPKDGFTAPTDGLATSVPPKWGFTAPTTIPDTSVPPKDGFLAPTVVPDTSVPPNASFPARTTVSAPSVPPNAGFTAPIESH